jgi:hypothetical protein
MVRLIEHRREAASRSLEEGSRRVG